MLWFHFIHFLVIGRLRGQLLHGAHKWAFMCLADIPSAYSPGRELSPHVTFLDHFTYPQQKSAHSLLILGFSNQEAFTLGSSPVKWLKPWCFCATSLGFIHLDSSHGGWAYCFLLHTFFTLSPSCSSLFLLKYTQSRAKPYPEQISQEFGHFLCIQQK